VETITDGSVAFGPSDHSTARDEAPTSTANEAFHDLNSAAAALVSSPPRRCRAVYTTNSRIAVPPNRLSCSNRPAWQHERAYQQGSLGKPGHRGHLRPTTARLPAAAPPRDALDCG